MRQRAKNGHKRTQAYQIKRREQEELRRLFERTADCYSMFIQLAKKYKLVNVESMSTFFNITKKKAKAVILGDLTQVTWLDYIRLTAKICYHGYMIERNARGKYGS